MLVPAVRSSSARYECVAPSAADAGAALEVAPRTNAELLTALTVHGGARLLDDKGGIGLTGLPGPDESGTVVFLRPLSGASGGVDPIRSRVNATVRGGAKRLPAPTSPPL